MFSRGRELFKNRGCGSCHTVTALRTGERIAPDLAVVGSKVQFGWLRKWLKKPQDYLSNARMPDFRLPDDEIEKIQAYLSGFTDDALSGTIDLPKTAEAVERGRKLIEESRCYTCHDIKGFEPMEFMDIDRLGPDLGRVVEKVTPAWITRWIENPKSIQPQTVMPRFRFTQDEILDVVAYLFRSSDTSRAHDAEKISETQKGAGAELVRKYGCFGCHRIPGLEQRQPVGAELTLVGSKPETRLDFGNIGYANQRHHRKDVPEWVFDKEDLFGENGKINHSRPTFFYLKLKDPRMFREDLKMPFYNFEEDDIWALVTYLMGFTDEEMPAEFMVIDKESDFDIPGDMGRIVRELSCLTCHSIKGRGGSLGPNLFFYETDRPASVYHRNGDIGPNLSEEGSKVQAEWLRSFLKDPSVIRPMRRARMPKFRLSDSEVEQIVRFMKTILLNDQIPAFEDGKSERWGEILYNKTYACRSCHRIDRDGGAVGPDLSKTGLRLEGDYMDDWIRDPQSHIEDVIMPRFGISDKNRRRITRFLLDHKGN